MSRHHSPKQNLSRREALRRIATGAGVSATLPSLAGAEGHHAHAPAEQSSEGLALGAALPPDPALTSPDWQLRFFDAHQNETVIVLSDLIIPSTDTPGAKAALANRFIDLLLSASPLEEQERYIQALSALDARCLKQYARPFVELAAGEQNEVLTLLTHPSHDPQLAPSVQSFSILKESIARAYYSSEVGMLRELKYETNPFQPEFPGCPNPEEHKSS